MQWQLERSQRWPPETLRAFQLRQLREVAAHAVANVPHYRDALRACGVKRAGALDTKSFRAWPILRKSLLMEHEAALHASTVPEGHGEAPLTQSTGSTGTPVRVRQTRISQFFAQALILREHLWHERDFSRKFAAAHSDVEPGHQSGWGVPNTVFATGPACAQNTRMGIDAQLDWLIAERPAYLLTRASNLRALLLRSRETGKIPPGIIEVISISEMLAPDVPALASELWHARVVDGYSCEEFANLACQCPGHEHYLVHAENAYLEVLREDGSPCAPGETGRVVVTALHNFAMPLIRYELGDYAELGERCPSGRGLPVLNRIVGRVRNMMRDPTGRLAWPSFRADLWLAVAPIRQVQLVQTALDRIAVRYVLDRELDRTERQKLSAALADRLGYDFDFSFQRESAIARAPGEKFEDFVSLIQT